MRISGLAWFALSSCLLAAPCVSTESGPSVAQSRVPLTWRVSLNTRVKGDHSDFDRDLGGFVVASSGDVAAVPPRGKVVFSCESRISGGIPPRLPALVQKIFDNVSDPNADFGPFPGRTTLLGRRLWADDSPYISETLILEIGASWQTLDRQGRSFHHAGLQYVEQDHPDLYELLKELRAIERSLPAQCLRNPIGTPG